MWWQICRVALVPVVLSASAGPAASQESLLDLWNKAVGEAKKAGQEIEKIVRPEAETPSASEAPAAGGEPGETAESGATVGTSPDSHGTAASAGRHYNQDRQRVADVQGMLNRLGYAAGVVDGLYGDKTRRAIMTFERDRELPVTGNVTLRLLVRLSQESQDQAGLQLAESRPGDSGTAAGTKAPGWLTERPEGVFPLTSSQMGLLAVKDLPDAISEEQLLEITRRQIAREQWRWQKIDDVLADMQHLNLRRPAFLYEFQRLQEQADPTMWPVLDVLIGPQPDWSFVRREPEWDDHAQPVVEAFVFTRDEIEGRNPDFAARDLAPVMMRLLETAASQAGGEYQITVRLPPVAYDFEAGAIRFAGSRSGSFEDEVDILPAPRQLVFLEEDEWDRDLPRGTLLPASARGTALYETWQVVPGDQVQRGPGRGVPAESPAEVLRQSFNVGPPLWRSTKTLAFDRFLQLSAIPVDAPQAEPLLQDLQFGKGLQARIVLRPERVELSEYVTQSLHHPASVLFATLIAVDILDRNGTVVASLTAENFPPAAELIAGREAAAEAEARANAEAEERAQETAEERLAALLGDKTGLVMIRRGEAAGIGTVYTVGVQGRDYKQIVRDNNLLDLPTEAKWINASEMGEVLRSQSDAAVLVRTSDFIDERGFGFVANPQLRQELVSLAGELDLTAAAFPPDQRPALHQDQAADLASLLPGDARYVMLRRRDDQEKLTRVVVQEDRSAFYGSQLREAAPFTGYLDRLGASIAFELPERAERVDLREIPAVLRDQNGTGVVLRRDGFENIFPKISDLDLVVRRFPPEEFSIGIPKDHTEGAEQFSILGISGGLDRAATLAAVGKAFERDEIVTAGIGEIRAERGACHTTDLLAAGAAGETGAFCLSVSLSDGVVSHVALRQVVPGDAEEAALKALREKYGRSTLTSEIRHLDRGGKRTVLGWGAPLSTDRASLGRVDAKTPPTVLEAVVWDANDVTTVLLHLDDVPTLEEVEAAQTPEIKF